MRRAIVVGSGPNGLAAAIRLADAGLDVTVLEAADRPGGGARSAELTLPGLVHDECSAFHPMALASPYLSSLGLERFGLRFAWPEVQFGHPLDDGSVGLAYRSLDRTAAALGTAGVRWRRTFGTAVRRYDQLAADVLRPLVHVPRHPVTLARFGMRGLLPATTVARQLGSPAAAALYMGAAAHQFAPLGAPLSSALGSMLVATAHAHGWPVAVGGSQSITDALVARLGAAGGRVETGTAVTNAAQLVDADVVIFDLMPPAIARIVGERMPARIRRAFEHYRFGPGAFKLDLAIDGGVPWRNPELRAAGTVHLGGTAGEVAANEAATFAGRMPEHPFVLVGQQSVADPSRAVGDVHPLWTYAHVPAGYTGDASGAIIAQLERFAPGVRERIVGRFVRTPGEFATHNRNYVGGDIAGGANDGLRVIMRPRWALNPYRAGRGLFIASAATPPGGGVHGMSGFHAAETALRQLGRR